MAALASPHPSPARYRSREFTRYLLAIALMGSLPLLFAAISWGSIPFAKTRGFTPDFDSPLWVNVLVGLVMVSVLAEIVGYILITLRVLRSPALDLRERRALLGCGLFFVVGLVAWIFWRMAYT